MVISANLDLNDYNFYRAYINKDKAGSISSISYDGVNVKDTVEDDGKYKMVIPTGYGATGRGLEYTIELDSLLRPRIQGAIKNKITCCW